MRNMAYAPRCVLNPDRRSPHTDLKLREDRMTAFQKGAMMYDQSSRLISVPTPQPSPTPAPASTSTTTADRTNAESAECNKSAPDRPFLEFLFCLIKSFLSDPGTLQPVSGGWALIGMAAAARWRRVSVGGRRRQRRRRRRWRWRWRGWRWPGGGGGGAAALQRQGQWLGRRLLGIGMPRI